METDRVEPVTPPVTYSTCSAHSKKKDTYGSVCGAGGYWWRGGAGTEADRQCSKRAPAAPFAADLFAPQDQPKRKWRVYIDTVEKNNREILPEKTQYAHAKPRQSTYMEPCILIPSRSPR